jgi:outer membrane protein assembly factor BamB
MQLSYGPRTLAKLSDCCACFSIIWLLFCGICNAAPSITLSKTIGPPTSQILVSGMGFEPNVGVDIYFDTKDEALVVTDGQGKFDKAKAYAPRQARPGQHWVTALERNSDKGAQKPFAVETDWPQGRYDPTGSGFNFYENVLNRESVSHLGLKWSVALPGDNAPTVADGVVYLTDSLGNVRALNAKSGRELWTYRDNGGSVFSSPAVVDGVVYFGGYDDVHALNAKTGNVIWDQRQCGGCGIFAVTVADDAVYFNTGQGIVYKLGVKNGSQLWSYNTGDYSMLSAPAVVNGVVYAASGDLLAINSKTGKLIWSYPIGNPQGSDVWDGPSVYNGVVYVGGSNSTIYALGANNGSLIWSSEVALESNISVGDGIVYLPSADGNLYALDAYSGDELWKYASPNLHPGESAVANGVVYVGMSNNSGQGRIVALDTSSGDVVWEYGDTTFIAPSVANGSLYVSDFYFGTYAFGLTRDRAEGSKVKEALVGPRPDLKLLDADPTLKTSEPVDTWR